MGPLMCAQMVGSTEDLTTNSAGVGLDPRVESHVPGQHVTARETSLTHVTEISFA